MFVAARHISVTRDGKLVGLNPGDPCPEAASFEPDVLMRCMKVGQIVNVERPVKGDAFAQQTAAKNEAVAKAVGKAPKKSRAQKAAAMSEAQETARQKALGGMRRRDRETQRA